MTARRTPRQPWTWHCSRSARVCVCGGGACGDDIRVATLHACTLTAPPSSNRHQTLRWLLFPSPPKEAAACAAAVQGNTCSSPAWTDRNSPPFLTNTVPAALRGGVSVQAQPSPAARTPATTSSLTCCHRPAARCPPAWSTGSLPSASTQQVSTASALLRRQSWLGVEVARQAGPACMTLFVCNTAECG